ncbi:MAG TPA: glycoside hydrolase family 3 N-terminal domain-containing protein [Candidatus Dormibacteraeota bacterium]
MLASAPSSSPVLSLRSSPAPFNPPSNAPSLQPTATAAPTATATPTPTPAPTPEPIACTNVSQLGGWDNSRLAMLTIAVPVSETAPGAALPEVQAGAGGLLLFGSAAPANLGAQLASVETQVPGRIGLLVMTDEEGGGIQRMSNLVGSLPWPAWMGYNWSPAQIQSAVTGVGRNMAADGVNMDLAPVIDVDGRNVPPGATNPDGWRSFSGNTAVVTRDGIAFMNGLQSSGVIAVLKHFPGLGGSTGNTDNGLAQTLPWSTLQQVAIPPFAAAINGGAQAIMVSNATVPGLTTLPASLSPAVMQELRVTLQFHGLVMTDSLSAGAISAAGYSMPSAAVQSLKAGADMVMFGLPATTTETVSQTFAIRAAIVSAVANGTLARSRLIDADAAVLASRHVNLCG